MKMIQGKNTDPISRTVFPSQEKQITVLKRQSFVRFVYPFLFDAKLFTPLTKSICQSSWGVGADKQFIWRYSRFPDDDLLPHVARYLNTGCNASCAENDYSTANLWSLRQNAIDSINWGLGAKAEWMIELPNGRTITFQWKSVELVLFRLGSGAITIEATPQAHDIDSWLDFIHYFRFFSGRRSPVLNARRRTGPDTWESFYPPAIRVNENCDKNSFGVEDILNSILSSSVPNECTEKTWWRDVFVPGQMIPYMCLLLENTPSDSNNKAQLFYRIRMLFHSKQTLHLSEEEFSLDHYNVLPYAKDQWFFFTLDGGGYVAMNPPKDVFFINTMPDHVRKQYFLLFLISANQRFSLLGLQQGIADNWLAQKNDERELTFECIYERLLEFEARVYFAQVMQKNHYHRCYLKCQEVFQITKIHEELSEEIQRMYESINLERSKRIQCRIDMLTFMIALPALVLSFINTPWESMKISCALRIIILILLISFGGVIVLCLRTSRVTNVLKRRMKKSLKK